jgi:FkbM family methyltransferase
MLPRLRYYLSSIPTLLRGVKNWPGVLAAVLNPARRRPFAVELQNGLRFLARTAMDVWIIKETCLDRDYEAASVFLQDNWTVVDIGAALGDFTVHAARQCSKGMVYAYEPFPESFALLEENVRLNGLTNARLFPLAVGGAAHGRLTLRATGAAVQHSTVAVANAPAVEVSSLSLDQIFDVHHLTRCDYLKIDCEGAEYDILFAAHAETLAQIRRICLEYHEGVTPHTRDDLIRFLREHGFAVTMRPNPVHAHLGFLYACHTEPLP